MGAIEGLSASPDLSVNGRGMMQRPRSRTLAFWLLTIGLLVSVLVQPAWVLSQDEAESKYFSETGFRVSGRFLTYFETYGGLEIFGYPISRPFISRDGILVQYFQKARIEWHPDNPDPYKVQLGLLGEELGYRKPKSGPVRSVSLRRVYFEETDHAVAYMFLDYFRDHGGIDVFGYPITDMYLEDRRVVQYFQRLKLIWNVGARGPKMTVGDLGELYVEKYQDRIPPHALEPYTTSLTPHEEEELLRDLQVIIDLRETVIEAGEEQVVSVLVLDRTSGRAVENALVNVAFVGENGDMLEDSERALTTGPDGRAQAAVSLEDVPPGTHVTASVTVTYQALEFRTEGLFLVWY